VPVRAHVLGGLLALAVLAVGCTPQSHVVKLGPTQVKYGQGAYNRVLINWTRSTKIIKLERLDTTIRVHSTCLAPDFIAAYVARYEHLFKLPRRERNRISAEMNNTWKEAYSFTVAAATTDFRWNDFDKKRSIWRVALINDLQQQVAPLEVKADKVINVTTREMFPYVGDFYRFYRIRFPKKLSDGTPLVRKDTRYIALRFAGPLGKTELVWRLR
jgi:hypothetical protein